MQLSVFNSLHYNQAEAAIPNEDEDLLNIGYSIIQPYLMTSITKGWNFDLAGVNMMADKNYQSGNILFYLVLLVGLARKYKQREGTFRNCNPSKVYDYYSLKCVENNLMCIGSRNGINYVDIWKQLKKAYEIDTECNSSLGIGISVINETFIIQ